MFVGCALLDFCEPRCLSSSTKNKKHTSDTTDKQGHLDPRHKICCIWTTNRLRHVDWDQGDPARQNRTFELVCSVWATVALCLLDFWQNACLSFRLLPWVNYCFAKCAYLGARLWRHAQDKCPSTFEKQCALCHVPFTGPAVISKEYPYGG